MRKLLSLLTASAIALSAMAMPVSAADEISLVANGETIECDQAPVIVDGRTLVPIRAIAEAVGAEVQWDNTEKAVLIDTDVYTLQLKIGESNMSLSSKSTGDTTDISIDVPAQIISERTMLPVRAVAEGLNLSVDWDSDTKTVAISTSDVTADDSVATDSAVEADDESTSVVEDTTEETTSVKIYKQTDYTQNVKQKITVEDKITVDDRDLLTVKVLYDEVEGNSAYNQFMADTANDKISYYINKYKKEVESKYNALAKDERDSFVPYTFEITYDVTYASDNVVSALCTPEEKIAGVSNATAIIAMVTDATGSKSLTIEDLTEGRVSTDTARAFALEKFNKMFQDSTSMYQTTGKFKNIYFDFAVRGELTADKLDFYLDSNGNYLFFTNRGIVAPYNTGITTVCVTTTEMSKL